MRANPKIVCLGGGTGLVTDERQVDLGPPIWQREFLKVKPGPRPYRGPGYF